MNYQEIPLRSDGTAYLNCYVQNTKLSGGEAQKRPAIIVCPGGAYLTLAPKEAEPVALRFASMGYQTFLCRYLTYFDPDAPFGEMPAVRSQSHYPEQLVNLMHAVALVREHAQEWGIDPEQICVMGFSAGAHLCCMLAEHWDDPEILAYAGIDASEAASVRPDNVVLGYPMLSAKPQSGGAIKLPPQELLAAAFFGTTSPNEELIDRFTIAHHVRSDMPRVFVWQTCEDTVVNPRDTVAFVGELMAAGVPCEFHLFERGEHAMGLCDGKLTGLEEDDNPEAATWVAAADAWLRLQD